MSSPKFDARFSADDWGLSPAVNEAILELARAGVLRSVSLFANLPYLRHGLPELRATGVKLAAHLNFTLGKPIAPDVGSLHDKAGRFRPFPSFLARGIAGLLRAGHVEREASAQLGLLRAECEIDSLNGHQHAHLLPWMAEPLAAAARAHGLRRVRMMDDSSHVPSRIAAWWSASRWQKAWPEAEAELTHYLWPTGAWNGPRLAAKLERAGQRSLLVHPASRDDFQSVQFADGLRAARVSEFESLRRLTR